MLAALPLFAAGAARAQATQAVPFAAEASEATVDGAITGQAFADHTLEARAGEELTVTLSVTETDGDGNIYFNVMAPDPEWEALYLGAMDGGASATVALPLDGSYTVRVYLMGNDADTGKTVAYKLDLSIR